ncbi:MAG TPA: hypothetical protein PLW10_07545, partial [Myxococcota bacterium]|nr:hypothetical protein [Myxococcota bacterium]
RWVGRAGAVALAVGAELATSSVALLALAEGDPVPRWWAVAAAGAVLLVALAVELRARPEVRDGSLSLAVGHLLIAVLGAATAAFGWDGGAPVAVVAGIAAIGLLGAGRLPRPWSGAPTATFGIGLGLASLPVLDAVATALIAASEAAGRPWSLDGATTAADLALQPVGVAPVALLGHLAALLVACLALGARWLVLGSLGALEPLHLSEAAIGVTIVALGTSVPEIGTSIIAARKGQADLAVGNAVGSSVFNVLGVLGLTASLRPVATHDVDPIDGVILIAVSLAGLVLVARPGGIGRVQGAILVMAYTLYVVTAFGVPI